MLLCALLASVAAVLALSANSAQGAATLPPNFARSQVVGGLASPTAMEFAPDGRLFVAEQRGTLRVVKAGGNWRRSWISLAGFTRRGNAAC